MYEAIRLLQLAQRKRVENRIYNIPDTDLDGPTYVMVLHEETYSDLEKAIQELIDSLEKADG